MDNIGLTGTDNITGFTGVAVGYCTYISGCNQILLSPKVGKDGTYKEGMWIDEQRITFAKKVKRVVLDNGKTPGFDKQAPKY